MSERRINLEEIMQEHVDPHCFLKSQCYERVIDAMKEACRQALELAAENAEQDFYHDDEYPDRFQAVINKQSILDAINQVE